MTRLSGLRSTRAATVTRTLPRSGSTAPAMMLMAVYPGYW